MDGAYEVSGFAPGWLERITEHFERCYIAPRKIAGCQILVARHGRIAYLKSLGHADLERDRPMAEDTIFRIYSMTKPVTSVALMTLYERGYFQLTDPVHRVLPSFRDQRVWVSGDGDAMQTVPAQRPVTFRDLLSHTGGLTYGNQLAAVGAPEAAHPVDRVYARLGIARGQQSLAEFADKIGRAPLRYQPGEHFMYSLSTDVCGALVEALSGQRFDRYLQETIFDPLGMRDTAFFVPEDKLPRFAACYRRGRDKRLELADDPLTSRYRKQPAFLSGGGGLTSTIGDYFRFCEMLRRGGELDGARVLGPRTIELMRRNHLPDGKDLAQLAIGSFSETTNEGVGFGLGFATTLDEVRAGRFGAGDFYWGGAASTVFWIDPKEELTVIFMTQLVPSRTFDFRGQLKSIVYGALVD